MNSKIVNFFILIIILAGGCASQPEQTMESNVAVKKEIDSAPFAGYMENCREDANYGMYSYLLMGYPGNGNNFIETIRVFIEKSHRLMQQNKTVDKRLLNNVFIPLWSSPPEWVRNININNPEQLDATARWIAQNYDHQCARRIMQNTPKSGRNNIYILSSLNRLAAGGQPSLLLKLEVNNGIEQTRFKLIDEFFRMTWHQRSWSEQKINDVAKLLAFSMSASSQSDHYEVPVSDYLQDGGEMLLQNDSEIGVPVEETQTQLEKEEVKADSKELAEKQQVANKPGNTPTPAHINMSNIIQIVVPEPK